MLVCDCLDLQYEDVLKAVKEYGTDFETIKDKSEVGTACGCCAKDSCKKVEMTLKEAIEKASKEC